MPIENIAQDSRGSIIKNNLRRYIPSFMWNKTRTAISSIDLLVREHTISYPAKVRVKVGGVLYTLEVNGPVEAWRAKTLVSERKYIEKMLETNCKVFFDVGACNASHTIPLAIKSSRVFSFEPNPLCLAHAKKNIDLNGLKNVEFLPLAISNFDGTGSLCINNLEGNAARLETLANTKNYKNEIGVRVSRLDTLLVSGKVPHPDVIKIDVEGEEASVIEGMGKIFRPRDIFVEIHPTYGINPEGIEKLLNQMGYDAVFAFRRTPEILCHFKLK